MQDRHPADAFWSPCVGIVLAVILALLNLVPMKGCMVAGILLAGTLAFIAVLGGPDIHKVIWFRLKGTSLWAARMVAKLLLAALRLIVLVTVAVGAATVAVGALGMAGDALMEMWGRVMGPETPTIRRPLNRDMISAQSDICKWRTDDRWCLNGRVRHDYLRNEDPLLSLRFQLDAATKDKAIKDSSQVAQYVLASNGIRPNPLVGRMRYRAERYGEDLGMRVGGPRPTTVVETMRCLAEGYSDELLELFVPQPIPPAAKAIDEKLWRTVVEAAAVHANRPTPSPASWTTKMAK